MNIDDILKILSGALPIGLIGLALVLKNQKNSAQAAKDIDDLKIETMQIEADVVKKHLGESDADTINSFLQPFGDGKPTDPKSKS